MPKFLAGCHYNEEEISWHLKYIYIGQSKLMAKNLQPVKSWKKLVKIVKGRILVGWAQKFPKHCFGHAADFRKLTTLP